jgi:hypothetical protein
VVVVDAGSHEPLAVAIGVAQGTAVKIILLGEHVLLL